MSTRSRIYVRLSNERKETKFKFNPELVGKPIDGTFPIPEVEIPLEAKYISIYHHWDGYPEGVGETLIKEFNTYEKAFNLLLGGYESTINGDYIRPYHAWRGEKEEPWASVQPNAEDKVECYEEYTYVFEDGKWTFSYDGEVWEDLETYLKENEEAE